MARTYDLTGMVMDTYSRASYDPHELERGVTRQNIDTRERVTFFGGTVGVTQQENDTSAFKKRKVTITDHYGNTYDVWRVIRPVWAQALQRLRTGEADGLMVDDLDRLARDPRDLEDAIEVVEHYGKTIISAVASEIDLTTESGILTARFMVNMANKSSRDTSRRLRNTHRHLAISGEPFTGGTRPFGWQDDRRTADPKEAALIREAVKQVLFGMGINTIAREWNKQGVKTPWGGEWNFRNLHEVLTRPRTAGLRTLKGELVKDAAGQTVIGQWDAIITPEEREQVLAVVASRARPRRRKGKYLLGSLLRCGGCGAKMWGNVQSARDATAYQCSKGGHLAISGARLEDAVKLAVGLQLLRVQLYWEEHEPDSTEPAPFPHEALIKELQAKSEAMMADYYAKPSLGQLILAQVEKAQEELADLERERALWTVHEQQKNTEPLSFDEWMLTSWETQRATIERYADHIIIKPTYKGANHLEERISIVWSEEATPWGDNPAPLLPWETEAVEDEDSIPLEDRKPYTGRWRSSPHLPTALAMLKSDPRATSRTFAEATGLSAAYARQLFGQVRAALAEDPDFELPPHASPAFRGQAKRLHINRVSSSPYLSQVADLMEEEDDLTAVAVGERLGISGGWAAQLMSEVRARAIEAGEESEYELAPRRARKPISKAGAPNSTRVDEVAALMREHPDWSSRQLGSELGLSHTHVQTLKREVLARAASEGNLANLSEPRTSVNPVTEQHRSEVGS